jgi:hypothetical protein
MTIDERNRSILCAAAPATGALVWIRGLFV